MSEAELFVGLAALGVAVLGAGASTVLGLSQLRGHLRQRSHAEAELTEAYALDQLRTDLMVLEMEYQFPDKPPSNRHNLHCPSCGRFARRVLDGNDTVVFCSVHEMQVVWKDIPVDWATEPTVHIEGVPVHHEVVSAEAELILPMTGPIDIIKPDQLSLEQLQEEGAVL